MKISLGFAIIIYLTGMFNPGYSQRPKRYSSEDIYKGIQKLNVLGSVLFIAAHPDDENTRLITYLSKAKMVNTAYLSLTRGDGGQNSIGPEQAELLGIVRTQELLSARKVDGGSQFFTRAMDFGYSKSADEALTIWDREDLLSDMIWVIRKFKPDVLITRFPPDERAGHGQHESSAILAAEAFGKANNSEVFPEQLNYVDPWQPERLIFNIPFWWNTNLEEKEGVFSVDIGEYDPLSGLSYSELAADSRSQHRSQAFGVTWTRGTSKEYLEYLKGSEPGNDIFDQIDISWNRVDRPDIDKLINDVLKEYKFSDPSISLPLLLEVRKKIMDIDNEFWKINKMREVNELIKACLGLYFEATTNKSYASPGDSITFNFEFTNRSKEKVILDRITAVNVNIDSIFSVSLDNNDAIRFKITRQLSINVPETSPYWLENPRNGYQYEIYDELKRGLANNNEPIIFQAELNISGQNITYDIPIVYTWTDRMRGQQYEPFEFGPKLFVEIKNGVHIFPDQSDKPLEVTIFSNNQTVKGNLHLEVPDGWSYSPQEISFNLLPESSESVFFNLMPPSGTSQGTVSAVAKCDGESFDRKMIRIEYDHFPKQLVYLPAEATVVKLNIKKRGDNIGYIMGAGDEVGENLEQIGYNVTYINNQNIQSMEFSQFDAIVFGIMAFNNNDYLSAYEDQFLDYVKSGGNIIVQYTNIRIGLKSEIVKPYPIEFSRSSASVRISEEDAKVNIKNPDHPVLNYPNKITKKDFDGWIQERGLYFPISWDNHYDAVISSYDTGEEPLDGGLLVTRYGEGYYVYTSYSWFRQLPAGVPGAYRIFANLISLGK